MLGIGCIADPAAHSCATARTLPWARNSAPAEGRSSGIARALLVRPWWFSHAEWRNPPEVVGIETFAAGAAKFPNNLPNIAAAAPVSAMRRARAGVILP
jgi:hypothetical protein